MPNRFADLMKPHEPAPVIFPLSPQAGRLEGGQDLTVKMAEAQTAMAKNTELQNARRRADEFRQMMAEARGDPTAMRDVALSYPDSPGAQTTIKTLEADRERGDSARVRQEMELFVKSALPMIAEDPAHSGMLRTIQALRNAGRMKEAFELALEVAGQTRGGMEAMQKSIEHYAEWYANHAEAGREPTLEDLNAYSAQFPGGGRLDESDYQQIRGAAGRLTKDKGRGNGITLWGPEGQVLAQVGGPPGAAGAVAGAQPTTGPHAALAKKTAGEVQKQMVSVIGLRRQLHGVARSFAHDFLTYEGKMREWGLDKWAKAQSLLGLPDLTQEDINFLGQFKVFEQSVEGMFNAYRQSITGAAAAVQELERLKKAFINIDMNPYSFQAAMGNFFNELDRQEYIAQTIIRQGLALNPGEYSRVFEQMYGSGVGTVYTDREGRRWMWTGSESLIVEDED